MTPTPSYTIRQNLHTIFLGACVDLFTANTISCSGEGQHLDAVVGVLLQSIQLKRRLGCCHISDLTELWWMNSQNRGDVQGGFKSWIP